VQSQQVLPRCTQLLLRVLLLLLLLLLLLQCFVCCDSV
jgi:hypothetical protein